MPDLCGPQLTNARVTGMGYLEGPRVIFGCRGYYYLIFIFSFSHLDNMQIALIIIIEEEK